MIGKVIKTLLIANTDLTTLVPAASIYPYVMNEDTPLPAIVYTIDGLSADYSKDGWVGDEISFSVISMSDNYDTLQKIITEVRSALEWQRGVFDAMIIEWIYVSGMAEGYNITESVFMNKLSFSVVIKSY